MTSPKKRVGIIGLYHESNTFIPDLTTLEHFERSVLLKGEDIRERYSAAHHEIGGFFQVLQEADIEAVPLLFLHAHPWGKVADETLATMWQWIEQELARAGQLDGILAAPHGAAVSETHPDMDGWWLSELRKKVGPHIPIIATADPHVNLSPTMVEACNALITYRENPHLDQRARGIEAASLMVRTLRNEIRPVSKAAFPPVAINIERQLTRALPLLSLQSELDRVRQLPDVLSVSLALGFPYADIEDMGSAFIVVTDHDAELAQNQADQLAQWLVEHREQYRGELISPEAALEMALRSPKPVGLLDMGDNTGGGAPGDSTILAHLCQQQPSLKTLFCVSDPESVQAAKAVGIGNRIHLRIGGKLPMTPAPPIETEVTVLGLYNGDFTETQPRHGGKTGGSMGLTAVVRTESGLTILLMSRRNSFPTNSAQPFYACGLEPKDFDIIILKGVHAPVGAYAELCPTLIRVNTPGITTADMTALPYQHLRKPLFPFDEISPT